MGEPDLTTLGRRVRWRRKALGLTQVQLAAKANIGQSALSSIENDDTKWLRAPNLLRLALVLNLSPGWLERGEGLPELGTYHGDASFINDLFEALTPANRRHLVGMAQVLLAEQAGVAYGFGTDVPEARPTVLHEKPSTEDPYPLAPVPPVKPARRAKKTTS